MRKQDELDDDSSSLLYMAAAKIRCLAYLIENQSDPGFVPLDMEEIRTGLGCILTEISVKIREVSQKTEENDLKSAKNRRAG